MNRSAIVTALCAGALTLGGCDQVREFVGMPDESTNAAAPDNASATATTAPAGDKPAAADVPANPALAAQMSAAAQELGASLPMKVDDVTTLTALRAEGTTFIYDMAVSRDIAPGEIETARRTIQANNQMSLCRDPNTSRLIGQGGRMTHRYTDVNGDSFETEVNAC